MAPIILTIIHLIFQFVVFDQFGQIGRGNEAVLVIVFSIAPAAIVSLGVVYPILALTYWSAAKRTQINYALIAALGLVSTFFCWRAESIRSQHLVAASSIVAISILILNTLISITTRKSSIDKALNENKPGDLREP